MSALPPKADMAQSGCDVRFVPKADIGRHVASTFLTSEQGRPSVGRIRPWGTSLHATVAKGGPRASSLCHHYPKRRG